MFRLEGDLIVGDLHDPPSTAPMDWVEASTGSGRPATPKPSSSFVPFSARPAALADFLDCDEPADYIGFASRHGLLGVPVCTSSRMGAEPIALWADAHRVLWTMSRLWSGDVEELEILPTEDGMSIRLVLELAELRLAGKTPVYFEQRFTEAGRPTGTDLLNTARAASTYLVNTILSEHAAPTALLSPGRAVAVLRIEGLNLFGSMAGELLQVMTGVRRIGECPGCGRINDLTGLPRHRVYCPGDSYAACRKAASRSGNAPRGRSL